MHDADDEIYDVVIVGGGVVGLAILRAATLHGWSCMLLEREPDLLSWASGSNSGIICTGVDAADGTLERALIRDSISRIRTYCADVNVPMRTCGSIVCTWPWDHEPSDLSSVLSESHLAGDTDAELLSKSKVLSMENNLNKECLGGLHIPGEIVVDPWLYSVSLAVQARANGATIEKNILVDEKNCALEDGIWKIRRQSAGDSRESHRAPCIRGRVLINAAGLWADDFLTSVVSLEAPFTSQPRRGQYAVYSMPTSSKVTHPIQPIPTERTKGIFVFSTLYDHIVVGPTSSEQSSRVDRRIDEDVARQLHSQLHRVLPGAQDCMKIGEYVGIRPGTNHRDYQIHVDFERQCVTAAGIRSTGLTASLGIGRHVKELLASLLTKPESSPANNAPKMPPINDLVEEYHRRGDEKVNIGGFPYRVTHPLTRLGWEMRTGIAALPGNTE